MGIWGKRLYQNDTSLDVKDCFEEKVKDGKEIPVITQELIEEFKGIENDPVEESLFWLALADTQWKNGVLLPEVKEKALYWIRNSIISEKEADKLEKKLMSEQPKQKETRVRKPFSDGWKIGDVYAYLLESDLAKEKGLYGRYFLVQKVDEGSWYPSYVVPIVYVKITSGPTIPQSIDEYNRLEFVQTWFSKWEERFWPIDMRNPKEDIEKKSKIKYETDEYGFLPEYRARLLNTSKRVIPSKLIFVGNYLGADKPPIEFIPHAKINIISIAWKSFEYELIRSYCGHNRREYEIYGKAIMNDIPSKM